MRFVSDGDDIRARDTLINLLLSLPAVAIQIGLGIAALVFVFYFSFWPMEGGAWTRGFTLEHYEAVFSSTGILSVVARTLAGTVIVAVVTTALAFPVAWYGGQVLSGRWKALFILIAVAPFWANYIVRTWAWMLMLGDNGLINMVLLTVGAIGEPLRLLYTDFAVLVTLVYLYLPYSIFALYGSVEAIPREQIEAAYDLGASKVDVFRTVILPLSLPGIAVSIVFVFARAIGIYVTPTLVGSPGSLWYGNIIVNQFKNTFNWPRGAAYSMVLFAFVLVVLTGASRLMTLRRVRP